MTRGADTSAGKQRRDGAGHDRTAMRRRCFGMLRDKMNATAQPCVDDDANVCAQSSMHKTAGCTYKNADSQARVSRTRACPERCDYDFAGRPVLTASTADTASARRFAEAAASNSKPARRSSLFLTCTPASRHRCLSSAILAYSDRGIVKLSRTTFSFLARRGFSSTGAAAGALTTSDVLAVTIFFGVAFLAPAAFLAPTAFSAPTVFLAPADFFGAAFVLETVLSVAAASLFTSPAVSFAPLGK